MAGDEENKDPCQAATALLNAGLLAAAEAQFEELEGAPASAACAAAGLSAAKSERDERADAARSSLEMDGVPEQTITAVVQLITDGEEADAASELESAITAGLGFDVARALKAAGFPEAAADVITAAIVAKPDAEVPADLKALAAAAGVHLLAAQALANAGLDAEANEELKLALQEDPTLTVPDELKSPTLRPDWWRDILGAVGPAVRTVVEILAVLAVLVALLILAVRGVSRLRLRLYAEQLGGAKDDAAAAPTTAAVQEQYRRLCAGGAGSLKQIPASAGTPTTVPKEVTGVIPSANLLVAAVVWLFSLIPDPSARVLTGGLRPQDPKHGAGLDLALSRRRGRVFGEMTVWESDFGPPAPQGEKDKTQPAYDNLATPAAAWLKYTVNNSRYRARTSWIPGPLKRNKLSILGTSNWRSYALFAVGVRSYSTGAWEAARRRYLDALAVDGANFGAAFNLAVTELQLAGTDPDLRERALTRLSALKAKTQGSDDSLWFRVRGAEVVARLRPGATKDQATAVRVDATQLCTALCLKVSPDSTTEPQLRTFLKQAKPGALILLASTLLVEESLLPDAGAGDPISVTLPGHSDPMTHTELVTYVETSCQPIGVEGAYNLACYYTRAAKRAEQVDPGAVAALWLKATTYLRDAIELGGAGAAKWALEDPALGPYRTDKAREDKLKKICEERTDPIPAQASVPDAKEADSTSPLEDLLDWFKDRT